MTQPKPRWYQAEAIDASIKFFESPQQGHGFLILPTGSGKSICIANIAKELPGKTVVFQPSKEILEQNYAKFTAYGFRASIYSASLGQKFIDKVTFATIGSVAKKHHLFRQFDNIIVDEAHETSFKQEDGVGYHARDVAVMRASILGAASALERQSDRLPEARRQALLTQIQDETRALTAMADTPEQPASARMQTPAPNRPLRSRPLRDPGRMLVNAVQRVDKLRRGAAVQVRKCGHGVVILSCQTGIIAPPMRPDISLN